MLVDPLNFVPASAAPPVATTDVAAVTINDLLEKLSMVSETSKRTLLKVLVVDDNDINLKILSRILSKHFGHIIQTTSTLSSGVLALDILSQDKFDLVFLDIDMPVLSGVETTIEIRGGKEKGSKYEILEANRGVPIIAVTTNVLEDEKKSYIEAGMNGCIKKPVCPNELKSAIETVMGEIITMNDPEEFSPDFIVGGPITTS